ncbi:MAG: aldo/keto reductase [Candidatus Lokiarchaeota archaeon]|nr:aldo/keto reductase [Candidatus Lokiarchaeota archaeon]
MKKIKLGKTDENIPILGQGTWGIKSFRNKDYYEKWKESIRKGIELGITHIDTAEMYGRGTSELIVGQVISEYNRDDLFITTKLFPMHTRYNTMKKAAYNSLKRLGIKQIDLYLIHWPSPLISIKKQMRVLEDLVNEGKVRYIGVSNFSVEQFKEAQTYLKNTELVNNQLPASITRQKHIEQSLPFYQNEGIIMTAYSPLGHNGYHNLQGDLREKLEIVAKSHNATIQQIAIAWLINHENVITIPKASKIEHMIANAEAANIRLSDKEITLLYEDGRITENLKLISA